MDQTKISNFHTHTMLCNHAEGMPDAYVSEAQKDGCSALGFSDHCPYPDSFGDIWPNIRMKASDASLYVRAVKEASEHAVFPVYTGFECEWDKRYESWYKDALLGEYGADYLVFGPHWVTDGCSHVYALDINSSTLLHRYADQTIQGIQSGLFAFIAHPDLCMGSWAEWDADAESCLSAILDAAIDCGLPLEINGLGMSRKTNQTRRGTRYQYPYDEFWQMVAARGAKVICNADAHAPGDVISAAKKAREYASRFGIVPLENPLA